MNQLWTIIFVTALAAVFAVASWHDREERRRRGRRDSAGEGGGHEGG